MSGANVDALGRPRRPVRQPCPAAPNGDGRLQLRSARLVHTTGVEHRCGSPVFCAKMGSWRKQPKPMPRLSGISSVWPAASREPGHRVVVASAIDLGQLVASFGWIDVKNQVEFRSAKCPPHEGGGKQINPVRWGKRPAGHLVQKMSVNGIERGEARAEDWGWHSPVSNEGFRLPAST